MKIIDIVNKKSKIIENIKRSKKQSNKNLNIEEKKKLIINNIDYKYKFNILQLLRNYLCGDELNKVFLNDLNKSLLLMIKNLVETKLDIYEEILDKDYININKEINQKTNKKASNRNKNIIKLIDGTVINLKSFDNEKNKIIIKKINVVMEEYYKLTKYNRDFDKKVLYYQNILNELIGQLQ